MNKLVWLLLGFTILGFILGGYFLYADITSKAISCEHSELEISYYRSNSFNAWLSPFLLILAATSGFLALHFQNKNVSDQGKRIEKSDKQNHNLQLENNFYRLIENHRKVVLGLSYNFAVPKASSYGLNIFEEYSVPLVSNSEIILVNRKGYECFWQFSQLLASKFKRKFVTTNQIELISEYNGLYKQYSSVLSHYLRQFYYLLVFIDDMQIFDDEILNNDYFNLDGETEKLAQMAGITAADKIVYKRKYTYAKILRAQLSSDELLILACNALTAQGEKSLFYIRKYRMIKNMNVENLPKSLSDFLLETYPHLAHELDAV